MDYHIWIDQTIKHSITLKAENEKEAYEKGIKEIEAGRSQITNTEYTNKEVQKITGLQNDTNQ